VAAVPVVATVPYLLGTLVRLGPRTALVAVTGAGLAALPDVAVELGPVWARVDDLD
jgi:hypothetical protein